MKRVPSARLGRMRIPAVVAGLLLLSLASAADLVSQTFRPQHLDLGETVAALKEVFGIDEIVADAPPTTIEVRATAPVMTRVDGFLKTFDTASPEGADAPRFRVYRLEHLATAQAVTLLRSKLGVRQCFQNPDRRRVALRDTPERLEQAAKLLAEADAPAR